MDLTERQWKRSEPLLPQPRVRKDGRGRPWRDPRDIPNGILWVMRTGARGTICRRAIRRIRPVIGGSSSGHRPVRWRAYSRRWRKISPPGSI